MKTQKELDSIVSELRSVKNLIAELEKRSEFLTDQLKFEMVESGEEVLTGDGWKASWKNVVSNRFDSKSFKKEHFDLYESFLQKVTTTRFLLN